jgi:hypothetical protein
LFCPSRSLTAVSCETFEFPISSRVGMENSCLTFVTPTLVAGDRSEVDVAAHEISHVRSLGLVSPLELTAVLVR